MANDQIKAYLALAKVFKEKGFSLYLTGGTVRDYFLKRPLVDMDVCTDATPNQVEALLPGANTSFKKYGVISYKIKNIKFDIATLRIEGKYLDSRHPAKIKYVTSLQKDYKRRDFTINALYLDEMFVLYDFSHGQQDIKDKIIRFIGNPKKRIKQDPLRILRGIRFALEYGFKFDPKTEKSMKKYVYLLNKINKEKIKEEVARIKDVDEDMKNKIFSDFAIHQFIDVVE